MRIIIMIFVGDDEGKILWWEGGEGGIETGYRFFAALTR